VAHTERGDERKGPNTCNSKTGGVVFHEGGNRASEEDGKKGGGGGGGGVGVFGGFVRRKEAWGF